MLSMLGVDLHRDELHVVECNLSEERGHSGVDDRAAECRVGVVERMPQLPPAGEVHIIGQLVEPLRHGAILQRLPVRSMRLQLDIASSIRS
ncbi:hypothetical protein MFUL124B02_41800 [Myxococcus fulvus 124B02]|nr:hypothetical protein MFUL124B02_41800 [Myxococcus fulvus 124B02]